MATAVLIDNATGLVVSRTIVEGGAPPAPSGHTYVLSETAIIGQHWNGADFDPLPPPAAPPPAPVPKSITRRQLILALLAGGFITSAEALAAAQSGTAPAFIAAQFNALPEPQKTAAFITWATMSVCERSDPLLAAVAATRGLTDAELDDYFRMAAAL